MTRGTFDPKENEYDHHNEGSMGILAGFKPLGQSHNDNWRVVVGVVLLVSGVLVLIDQFLHLSWIGFLVPAAGGLILLYSWLRTLRKGYLISGAILAGLGCGIFYALAITPDLSVINKLGAILIGLAFGFAAITLLDQVVVNQLDWWALIPAAAITSVAVPFLTSKIGVLDFELYIVTVLGLILLAVGVYRKLIGLIIPGCLLIGIGPGVAIAWNSYQGGAALTNTGTMLVWFSFGWGLITLFSRTVIEKFVWWPLIPGGILAMVGGGLYIGGNPGNAVSFISNTGSIVMIIFGLYLLLMRRGIRH
jgi:hypothetical protein